MAFLGSPSGPQPPPDHLPLSDALLRRLPEFLAAYHDLVDACGDDPGEALVLIELADFVAERLSLLETEADAVRRALGTIEACIDALDPEDQGALETLAGAFFDSFSPEDYRRLVPWLGPASRALVEEMDAPMPAPPDRRSAVSRPVSGSRDDHHRAITPGG